MMKPTFGYKFKGIGLWLLAALWLAGCMRDETGCGQKVTFAFYYDYNPDHIDRFTEQVIYLDLYLFDEQDNLVDYQEIRRSELLHGNMYIRTDLNPGSYTLVAWGNSHTDDYQIEGSSFADMNLYLRRQADGAVTDHPGTLFHGAVTFRLAENAQIREEVYMVKNTNLVNIVIRRETDGLRNEIEPENVRVTIMADNGRYAFDNSVIAEQPLTYHPILTVSPNLIESTFTVMRIWKGDDSRLIIRDATLPESDGPLYTGSLTELILKDKNVDDEEYYLDIMDEHLITLRLKGITIEVVVDDWEEIPDPKPDL